MEYLNEFAINRFITLALAEDIGEGDFSSQASISENAISKARLLVKDDGVIAGVNLAERILLKVQPDLEIRILLKDGSQVKKGDVVFEVHGNARAILAAERLLLNCMQRMSGIATKTFQLNQLIARTNAKLLDTRKTTPNFRMLEKWAVLIGGGTNHRFGLFDMIMLKDNHIDMAGGISNALNKTFGFLAEKNLDLKVIVEARNIKEVEEVLEFDGVYRILLDNMPPYILKQSVELIKGKIKTEASGGVDEKSIKEIAETGVDFISVGALTHSFKSLDLSLKAF